MGIFRISANSSYLEKFIKVFKNGEYIDLVNEPGFDCHLAAGLLKAYFRTLKDPVFPKEHYSSLLVASDIEDNNEQISVIKDLFITHLKPEDLNSLTHLFNLLNEVAKKKK